MVLRQSPDTRVMSCFHVKCSLSSACLVSCWSVVFGSRHSCLEFWFRVGVLTLVRHVSLCVCVLTSCLLCLSCVVIFVTFLCCHVPVLFLVFLVRDTRWLRALLSTCVARSSCFYRLCAFVSCAVWHAACVFHWLRAFMLSCLVWTRGLWVLSLAVCSCPVLHMSGDFCFAGHVLVFLFCVSTWLLPWFSVCHVLSCQLSWPHPSFYLIIG